MRARTDTRTHTDGSNRHDRSTDSPRMSDVTERTCYARRCLRYGSPVFRVVLCSRLHGKSSTRNAQRISLYVNPVGRNDGQPADRPSDGRPPGHVQNGLARKQPDQKRQHGAQTLAAVAGDFGPGRPTGATASRCGGTDRLRSLDQTTAADETASQANRAGPARMNR